VRESALEAGLSVYPMNGTIDGKHGDHVVIAPPYIAQPEHITAIVERLGTAVDAALAGAMREAA
jgi:adenosylmethionine-8-amino-7-oxononanoate aminotransferase